MFLDADKLNELLHKLSHEYYSATWMTDWGYRAWACVLGETAQVGLGSFNMKQEEITELQNLSDSCGGWFYYPPEPKDDDREAWKDYPLGPLFIEKDQWLQKYAIWKSERIRFVSERTKS